MKLGERTMRVFRFVAAYVKERGYAPPYRAIAAGCGLKSTSTVAYHLGLLFEAGYLAHERGRPRALAVLKEFADHA